jgi:hypothetical protein
MKSDGRDKAEVNDRRKAELDAHWREFWQEHKDFESPWTRNVLHNLSEFLPLVFKFGATPYGLKQLYERSEVPSNLLDSWTQEESDPRDQHSWTDASEWLPSTALRRLPIFQLDLALRAYAYYGLKLELEQSKFYSLEEFLEQWESDWSLIPREWCAPEQQQAIMAALARRKLDGPKHGETITPDELAALARVGRKSIMNLLAPKNGGLTPVEQGGELAIEIESARNWLRSRSNFRPSVWQYQDGRVMGQPLQSDALQLTEPIFVPVASDSMWFSPEHHAQRKDRPGQRGKTRTDRSLYYVANGDHEESYENYWEALDFLNRAELPRWRYADGGQWRTKNVNGWTRKSRHEIEALLNTGDNHVASKG